MNYCYHTRAPVERPRDTLVTLGYQWGQNEIIIESRVKVGPPRDTVPTLGYQWNHQKMR